jgi:hypothetical protein
MRATLILALLPLAAAAAAAQEPPTASPPSIVITGTPPDYRGQLDACLARACPVNEDVDASLTLAEALFLQGEYRDARSVVLASLRRNRGRAGDFPEPVSDLWRADARLARHIGFDRDALQSTYRILDALQQGLPQEDHRHFTARLEIANLELRMGRAASARRELRDLIREARAAGREDVVVTAEIRMMLIDYVTAPRGMGRAQLERIARSTDPAERVRSINARLLLAKILRDHGEAEEADALLAEIGRGASADRRRLLYAPSYQLNERIVWRPGANFDVPVTRSLDSLTQDFADMWVDVGFWVMPDGRVAGVEVVRSGDSGWAGPLLAAVEGRRYTSADRASYRLERYTLTAGFGDSTGSRIQRQTGAPRVEYLDLTSGEEVPPGPPPTVGSG